jgi:hypothetical protein
VQANGTEAVGCVSRSCYREVGSGDVFPGRFCCCGVVISGGHGGTARSLESQGGLDWPVSRLGWALSRFSGDRRSDLTGCLGCGLR